MKQLKVKRLAILDILGRPVVGGAIVETDTYRNVVIMEDPDGERYVVHKKTLDPKFKPTKLTGSYKHGRRSFDLKASQKANYKLKYTRFGGVEPIIKQQSN
ncbi:hypothetical protein [Facklamia hominis]|uniref:hypothetical protein n=1 Tax=Facklamia hominis TaxID=178214 RepID=UPI00101D74DD|nr:hypothetical protein [Facklamia hominis]RYC97879.1 hypothetical protein EKN08_05855 [Facklamia hominis]